jgi:hypothetical protein
MSQPPVPGPGLGEEPASGSRLPDGSDGLHGGGPLRLADFAKGGPGDACLPGPELAAVLEALSGPDQRCAGASDDELVGLLGRWAAVEAWAAARKLGVLRELIRRRAGHIHMHGPVIPGELPRSWDEGTGHEVSAALGLSLSAADKLTDLAWTLRARLPGIGAKLADGIIDAYKAAIIVKELAVLDDEHAAQAEALILDELAGKTAGMIGRLAARAVDTVDPEGSRKRREYAERELARVRFWRENTGTAAMAACGLPPDAALAASANVDQRAKQYKAATVSPGARMDQLRVLAFCDILNGITADTRITQARAAQADAQSQPQPQSQSKGEAKEQTEPPDAAAEDEPLPDNDSSAAGDDSPAGARDTRDDGGSGDGQDNSGRASGTDPEHHGTGPGRGQLGGGRPGAGGPAGDAGPVLPALSNLTISLATLLGLADRPGDAHGFGSLDPALARDLAAAAARSPHSRWCLTVTDANGYAIGHGCARPTRTKHTKSGSSRGRDGPWTLSPRDGPGPPGGYGTWTLTLPGGRELTVNLGPLPVTGCDHRHESHCYQPSDTLRHLVEIRDGTCTFPTCSRHARDCDFEHATPYDQGGRTCACNAGARSRRCHRVKQSNGWTVTQPRPGWHQWTTPSGRTYTQGPMRYPM